MSETFPTAGNFQPSLAPGQRKALERKPHQPKIPQETTTVSASALDGFDPSKPYEVIEINKIPYSEGSSKGKNNWKRSNIRLNQDDQEFSLSFIDFATQSRKAKVSSKKIGEVIGVEGSVVRKFLLLANAIAGHTLFTCSEPEQKDTSGYVLWQIFNMHNANYTETAARLGISVSYLSIIIHGKRTISQKILAKLEKDLKEFYREGFNQYKDDFYLQLWKEAPEKLLDSPYAQVKIENLLKGDDLTTEQTEPLTPRERQVVVGAVTGQADIKIGQSLGIAEGTESPSRPINQLKEAAEKLLDSPDAQVKIENLLKGDDLTPRQTEPLTPRERQVVVGAVTGQADIKIGQSLGIAERTVNSYMTEILRKLGLGDRSMLAAKVIPKLIPAITGKPLPARDEMQNYWRDSLGLTCQESKTAVLLINGDSDKAIASTLKISWRTSPSHVGKILKKTGADCRCEAIFLLLVSASLALSAKAKKEWVWKNKSAFGFILWQIIGGEKADFEKAGLTFGFTARQFKAITRGEKKISQQMIAEKQWYEVLAAFYPDGWKKHKDALIHAAHSLPKWQHKRKRVKTPDDPDTIGYVLWKILGGDNAYISYATKQIGIEIQKLGHIIHGYADVTQQDLIDWQLREKLATHYPEGWQCHKKEFEEKVYKYAKWHKEEELEDIFKQSAQKALGKTAGAEIDAPSGDVLSAWKLAAGEFVQRVMNECGDEVKDLVRDVQAEILKKNETWKMILEGTADSKIVAPALHEISRLYRLGDDPRNPRYEMLQWLMTHRPPEKKM